MQRLIEKKKRWELFRTLNIQARLPTSPPPKLLEVKGCKDPSVKDIVNGIYHLHTKNHGNPAYRKAVVGSESPSYIYFWDKRGGREFNGWWIGGEIGGDTVWAFCSWPIWSPPSEGWKVPHDAKSVSQTQAVPHPYAECDFCACPAILVTTCADCGDAFCNRHGGERDCGYEGCGACISRQECARLDV